MRARAGLWLLVCVIAGCRSGTPAPDHLLLITVDTLRADRLGAYGSDRGLTPHLDALAAEALVFHAAYAPAPFTVPSLAGLMTGRHPVELGIWNNESGLPGSAETLAGALAGRGWRTGAVVSNFVLRERSGLAAGFEIYDDRFDQREAVRNLPERRATQATDRALGVLDRLATPETAHWFLWVHYQDPHGPYTPPRGRRARYLERERRAPGGRRQLPLDRTHRGLGGIPNYQVLGGQREVAFYRAGYDAEVSYMDEQVGRLLAAVAARGPGGRTAIVFVADHGEGLGEGDYWFAHGEHLTDPSVRVPLLMRIPGVAPAARHDVVSVLDVAPTLLRLLAGVPLDPERPTRDLLAPDAAAGGSRPYLVNIGAGKVQRHALVDGDYKLIVEEGPAGPRRRLVRRGQEDVDLSTREPEVARAMQARLTALRGTLEAEEETRQEVSEEDRAKLRALGYVDAPRPSGR